VAAKSALSIENADKPTVVGIVTADIAKAAYTPTKAASISAQTNTLQRTKPSITLPRNTRAVM
jgi:hypothetical protein